MLINTEAIILSNHGFLVYYSIFIGILGLCVCFFGVFLIVGTFAVKCFGAKNEDILINFA